MKSFFVLLFVALIFELVEKLYQKFKKPKSKISRPAPDYFQRPRRVDPANDGITKNGYQFSIKRVSHKGCVKAQANSEAPEK